jgi:hypothetical protein
MYNLNIHQQLWGYKVEEKLYLGVREQKRLNTTELDKGLCGVLLLMEEKESSSIFDDICFHGK